ncbi:MAG: VWA domain-containing protein [Planctomycetota bacterium]
MGFLHPELLLLIIPALAVGWYCRGVDRATRIIRFIVIILITLAAAGIYLHSGSSGRDLVIVIDRSRSMPGDITKKASEAIRLAEDERGAGDRVGIVSFGGQAATDRIPSEAGRFNAFQHEVDADGSDLYQAVTTALHLIPEERQGSIFVISDGEANGRDPMLAARRAFSRNIPIHVRAVSRSTGSDLSIERVDLPDSVAVGEPFQFVVWIRSDIKRESNFSLERDGQTLSSGKRIFEAGLNRLVFRDVLQRAGTIPFKVKLSDNDDRTPENNQATAAMNVEGAKPVLIINDDGAEDTLAIALRKARIPVTVAAPEKVNVDALSLTAYRAVILENVSANRLKPGLSGFKDFVVERGGGLLITGGKASYGVGGYYKSAIEDILPVTMELRQEHRKFGIALAVALDRSGSMAAPVGNNLQKMDLANLGTCAAIELLSPLDSVSVIAVDSSAHVVQPLTPAVDIPRLTATVRTIRSMGGGIFCYTALVAAGKELEGAKQQNRHIILFADAADAEEPGDYINLFEEYRKVNITTSVIGLGKETDRDAAFIIDMAKRGGGQHYFTEKPEELPRLFSQDTMTVARTTFVDQNTPAGISSQLYTLGEIPGSGFPNISGYNLTYLRPDASAGIITKDDYKAPVFAFMYQGLGRSAAYTGQVGGSFGSEIVAWDGFSALFVTITRWLVGQEEPRDYFTSVRRDGKDAVIRVDTDPEAKNTGLPAETAQLTARITDPSGSTHELKLERVDTNRFEARYPLTKEGISLGTVKINEKDFISLPPMALPYSPEFERAQDPEQGAKLLRQIAEVSGGIFEPEIGTLFKGDRAAKSWRLLTRELLWAAVLLLTIEIAGRRLGLWGQVRVPAGVETWVEKVKLKMAKRAANTAKRERAADTTIPSKTTMDPAAAKTTKPTVSTSPPQAVPSGGVSEALAKAKKAAGKQLGK